MLLFLLTRPLRDVTSLYRRSVTIHYISTHTPLTGRDFYDYVEQKFWQYFYSHAPYGTWPISSSLIFSIALISTHTPLTGRDERWWKNRIVFRYFYSHAPYGTWRYTMYFSVDIQKFLLTRPLRDVTRIPWWYADHKTISTHTPLTGRDNLAKESIQGSTFLLTRPLRDVTRKLCYAIRRNKFLLTRPLRDVTSSIAAMSSASGIISTHTPLTGRDVCKNDRIIASDYFYSHAPYGTWRNCVSYFQRSGDFYSHAPYGTWRALFETTYKCCIYFYSHAPYGTWRDHVRDAQDLRDFYSHAPYGTWRKKVYASVKLPYISTHTPLTGRDRYILYLCNGTFPHIGTDLFLLISFIWYRIYNLFIIMFFQANLKWFLNHHTFATFK